MSSSSSGSAARTCPVEQLSHDAWVVRGHFEVLDVALDHDHFRSCGRNHLHVPNGMDGDEHRRFRAVTDRHLDDELILALEPMIAEVARGSVEDLFRTADEIAAEVIAEYGRIVAARVQSRWLGWPAELETRLLTWIGDNTRAVRARDREANARVAADFDTIVRGIIDDRRAREAAGQTLPDDPTTHLLHDTVEDPQAPDGHRPLRDAELVSMLRNWTSGDLGSIADSIGVVVAHVARDADLQAHLRALSEQEDEHREELDSAVDEMLRLADPFPANARFATAGARIAGQQIPEGDRVALAWAQANRDPSRFEPPERYDPANRPHNLVYGAGVHVCPGRLLSTLQIRGALTALLRGSVVILPMPGQDPVRKTPPAHGFDSVPVHLHRKA